MSDSIDRPRAELSEVDLARLEEFEQEHGPLSVSQRAVETGSQILISVRNNKKSSARVKAFDRHMNMVLVNVTEMWTERPTNANGKRGKPVEKDRFISKMFLRGDGVVLVVPA